jgi:hypothetical protein
MLYHCITYFVFGIIASSIFNYRELFEHPIIIDYYKPYGSTVVLLGPALQIIRGLLFGFVLLPIREYLRNEKLGWLWLWSVFIVIGIIGTPAASPSSIEGLIYTKIPVWFHLIGLPEITLQTLAFSILVHRKERAEDHPLPKIFTTLVQSLVFTCISFIGYTVISIMFALLSGVKVSQNNADFKVLGQFIAPIVLIYITTLINKPSISIKYLCLYILSVSSIWLYQEVILGSGGWTYSIVAPILPSLISFILGKKAKTRT